MVGLNASGFPSSTGLNFDNVIASTVFTPTANSSDFLAPIFAVLNAGTYGIVFGSNLFGATGSHTLSILQTPTVTSTGLIFISNTSNHINWTVGDPPPNRVRLLVSAAVPVPATLLLFMAGLIGLGVTQRKRMI